MDMFHIPIRQNLLALPGTTINNITEIHSHHQALRQCHSHLSHDFPHCLLVEEADTAESARRLRDGELPATAAVIANKTCAQLYRLSLLKEDIHDDKNNLTLFLAVKKFEALS